MGQFQRPDVNLPHSRFARFAGAKSRSHNFGYYGRVIAPDAAAGTELDGNTRM